MKFSYNWLKELVAIKETPEKLAGILTMCAFEVESVEKIKGDAILTVALPPNRVPDAAGHRGMAQEIAALLNKRIKNQESRIEESKKEKTKDFLSVSIEAGEQCRRYLGRVVRDITIADSPVWLAERLVACGLRPINNIVDATNYTMLETGQPLHVFDLEKLEGGKIIVRLAKKGERMKTLDGEDVSLMENDLVIADAKDPIALAGIKGGIKAEVDVKTRHIVLEAATFDGSSIRKTSRRAGSTTDASHRFEYGLDPELAFDAMERLAALIAKISKGEVLRGALDVYPKKEKKRDIYFDPSWANALLGIDIPEKTYEDVFSRIGCAYKKRTIRNNGVAQKEYAVVPPPYRRDIVGREDLAEEAIRIYGYEHIPEKLPYIHASAEKDEKSEWSKFIRKKLCQDGFIEVYRYAFLGLRDIGALGALPENYIQVQNPVSPQFEYLVREPYENFFSCIRWALEHEGNVRIFSLDTGFVLKNGTGGDGKKENGENTYLTVASATGHNRNSGDGREDLYLFKGVIADLFDSIGIDDYWFDDALEKNLEYPRAHMLKNLHPHRRAEIKIGSETVGIFGEVHPLTADAWKISSRIYMAEIFFDALLSFATSEIEFQEIPKFPASSRDISLVVSHDTRIEDVQGVIENSGGALLEDVDFFDEFMGEGVPDMKRSLAFRLVFRDQKRTLEEKEVEERMKKIISAVQENGWEMR